MLCQFFRKHSVPISIVIFSLLSYGLLIPFLGFYWDDWPMIWFSYTQGPGGFPSAFAGDRPFLAMIYQITTTFIKYVPWQWQLLGIFSKIVTSLAFWWAFSQVWPNQKQKLAWAALLFVVYPGFKQQPISVVYSNGYFLLAAYFLSFGFMALAIRRPAKAWLYTLAGVASFLFCFLSTEYYFGLEMIRPVILFLMLAGTATTLRQRLTKTILHWLPYLIPFAAIFIWRVFIFQFPTYQPVLLETAERDPLAGMLELVWRTLHDPLLGGVEAWSSSVRIPLMEDLTQTGTLLYCVLVLFTFGMTLFILFKRLPPAENNQGYPISDQNFNGKLMLTGGLSLLFAGAPIWVTGLRLELSYPYDRFTLAYMMGSALFLTGLISWLVRTQAQRMIIIALLVAMAVGENFNNANTYRKDWLAHNDFFQQLSWRVPGLIPGTVLLTYDLPLHYYSDNSLTGPLNLIYANENKSLALSYYFAFLDVRVGHSIPALSPGLPISQPFRNAVFNGSTDQILVLFYSPPGCLRVLDPVRDADLRIMQNELLNAVPISNPGVINTDLSATPWLPEYIFGSPETEREWCYYYQKADLARQAGNWQQALTTIEDAYAKRLGPQEPSEILLPIEIYGMNGNWQRVDELLSEAYRTNSQFSNQYCKTLDKIADETADSMTDSDKAIYEKLSGAMVCFELN